MPQKNAWIAVPLIAVILAAGWWMAGQAQRVVGPLPPAFQNLSTAQVVQVKDASGKVVLTGKFATSSEDADEVEKSATLTATEGGSTGKAEIELERAGNVVTSQEIEVELRRLTPNAQFTLFVDGSELWAITTGSKGSADLKLTSKIKK